MTDNGWVLWSSLPVTCMGFAPARQAMAPLELRVIIIARRYLLTRGTLLQTLSSADSAMACQ